MLVECVVGGEIFSPVCSAPIETWCPGANDFLKVLGGDLVMFLYSKIKNNPVLYNSPKHYQSEAWTHMIQCFFYIFVTIYILDFH